MAARLREHDWASTPLGPMASWPQSLRVAVGICLNSRFPMFVWWGEHLINIYNDAYIPILGKRHPQALGKPARQTWQEIWPVVGPQAEAVMHRGEATWNERVLLVMERHGYTEETWFTWSYSPIPDDSGTGIGGLFCACTEDTPRVKAERERDRLAEQRQLALNAARMGWWHYDPLTRVASWDERYAEIFGVAGDHAPNDEILQRLHPDDRPAVQAKVNAALDPIDPKPYSAEFRIRRDDGVARWIEAHGQARFEGEGPTRRAVSFVGTVADVTERKRAEERTRIILESITDAFFALDPAWRFTYVNRQAERVLEREPGDLLGKVLWEEYPGLSGSEFERVYRKAATQRVSESVTAFYADHRRWYEVHAYPAPDGGISVYFRDVTQRMRDEQALQDLNVRLEERVRERTAALAEANAKFQAVYDQGIFAGFLDLDGRVLDVNRSSLEQCGFRREDVIGKLFWDCGWWNRSTAVQEWMKDGVTRARAGETFRGESVYFVADGSERLVEFVMMPIKDAEGRVTFLLPTGIDVTDRRRFEQDRLARESLLASEERFRQLADTMPQMVWVTRRDGFHEYYNRRWYEFTGVPDGSTDGEGWSNMFHPDDQERAWSAWRRSLATGEPYEIEYRLRHRSGQYRWTLGRALPIRDERGEIERWFGTCTDIDALRRLMDEREALLASERAARAEAERASEAKSDFLATLSHELRTPLTPVLLTVSLMESNPDLPESMRQDVATIRRNVELESRLISDLLDLTRITKGKLQLDMQDVDLHPILRGAIDICQREASAKLVVELAARRHRVRGDSTRLQQIFWNLINNAMKFTGTGGTVTVRTADAADDAEARVRVEVIDTGVGIDPAVLPRLFNAFEQGEVRAQQQQAGLGLGLAISKKLTEAHGGTISVASAGRGRGATFTVELPALTSGVTTLPARSAPPGRAVSGPALSVLVVEDHEATLTAMMRLLRHLGHHVTGATSVASATAAARQDGYDLIISDLGLPDGSGLDVMRELRERYAGRAIALTGYGMESDIAASRDAGFAEHLTKPVDLAALEAAIARIIAMPRRGDGRVDAVRRA